MSVSRETVLYFEPEGGARAAGMKSVLVRMGVRIKNIAPEDAGQTVGCLLGRRGFDRSENTGLSALAQPVLVLDGFTDKRLEILLREMKKAGVSIPYKAIVTETNIGWTLENLYQELAAEHEAMSKNG